VVDMAEAAAVVRLAHTSMSTRWRWRWSWGVCLSGVDVPETGKTEALSAQMGHTQWRLFGRDMRVLVKRCRWSPT
jgi:hypothetical protein